MFQIFKEFHERQEKELHERPVGATYGEGGDGFEGDGGEGMAEEPDEGVGDEEEEDARPSPDRFATDGPAPRLDKQELFGTFKETHAQGREIESRFRSLKDELKSAKGRVGQLVQEVNK